MKKIIECSGLKSDKGELKAIDTKRFEWKKSKKFERIKTICWI